MLPVATNLQEAIEVKLRCLVATACLLGGCQSDVGQPPLPPTQQTQDPATGGKDPVAACDQAADGTPCGDAGHDMHCIFNACVKNVCGDGFPSGSEQCDDGDQVSGDGCSASCKKEVCGNGTVDVGEACDDGNTMDGDGCSSTCQIEQDAGSDQDGGTPDGSVRVCPPASSDDPDAGIATITASAKIAAYGEQISLEALETDGASYRWYSGTTLQSTLGGRFEGDTTKSSATFICLHPNDPQGQLDNYPYSIPPYWKVSVYVTKDRCDPVVYEVPITCLPPVMDAGTVDAGGLDAGHHEIADAGSEIEGGAELDAGRTQVEGGSGTDAGGGGTLSGLSDACKTCLQTACSDYNGVDLFSPCMAGGTDGVNGPVTQPAFGQACANVVACSINAPSNCAANSAGPFGCYCGNETIDQCAASGPTADAECRTEWEVATGCADTADPKARNDCVVGARFQNLDLSSGVAFFLIACANDTSLRNNCKAICGL